MSVLISKSPRLPEDLAIAESLTGKVQTLSTASLSNWQWRAANLISAYDVENAEAIVLAQSTGTQRPQLSQCLAMVENESAGRNIFGEEGTACPSEWYEGYVNEPRYVVYRDRRDAGDSPDGVGPTQITDAALQIEAQRLGGCWNAQYDCDVGFHFLHELMVVYGTADGYMHYNGSGPAAEDYRDKALIWERVWHGRFVAHGLAN
jgi:hypothetical protein